VRSARSHNSDRLKGGEGLVRPKNELLRVSLVTDLNEFYFESIRVGVSKIVSEWSYGQVI